MTRIAYPKAAWEMVPILFRGQRKMGTGFAPSTAQHKPVPSRHNQNGR